MANLTDEQRYLCRVLVRKTEAYTRAKKDYAQATEAVMEHGAYSYEAEVRSPQAHMRFMKARKELRDIRKQTKSLHCGK